MPPHRRGSWARPGKPPTSHVTPLRHWVGSFGGPGLQALRNELVGCTRQEIGNAPAPKRLVGAAWEAPDIPRHAPTALGRIIRWPWSTGA